MDDLIEILKDAQIAINAAKKSAYNNDVSNALYNIDHAETDIMRARALAVSILHHGEVK